MLFAFSILCFSSSLVDYFADLSYYHHYHGSPLFTFSILCFNRPALMIILLLIIIFIIWNPPWWSTRSLAHWTHSLPQPSWGFVTCPDSLKLNWNIHFDVHFLGFGLGCTAAQTTHYPQCAQRKDLGASSQKEPQTCEKKLLKLRHESEDLNSSSHYHVKLIWCLLTLVGSTLILLHTGMEWPFKGNQNKKFVAYCVSGENGNISRMFLSKTDWRYHGEKVVFDHSCCEASKALSVLCGDSSLIFIFHSVAISTEILTHYSCFMEKNEKWGSGLNFINSIKDLPQQNIWK